MRSLRRPPCAGALALGLALTAGGARAQDRARSFGDWRLAQAGHDRLVAFACKGRGFCPSCGGRRVAETAAYLVDRVLPAVPVRQWLLSLPFALRYALAKDHALLTAVLQVACPASAVVGGSAARE